MGDRIYFRKGYMGIGSVVRSDDLALLVGAGVYDIIHRLGNTGQVSCLQRLGPYN